MAAFVVALPRQRDLPYTGLRLLIFPGSAAPSVVAARSPFWVGYGFVPDAGRLEPLGSGTRFELDVDGTSVELETQLEVDDGRPVSKMFVAEFRSGLDVGWHRLVGRWYDDGVLALSTDRWIEFVER